MFKQVFLLLEKVMGDVMTLNRQSLECNPYDGTLRQVLLFNSCQDKT